MGAVREGGSEGVGRSLVGHGTELLRAGLVHVVEAAGLTVAGSAAETASLLELLEREPVEVVVCEAALPGGGGLAVLDELLARERFVPIVACVDPDDRSGLPWGFFQAAVSGRVDAEQLRTAVAVVRAGGTYVDPVLRELLKEEHGDAFAGLTSRELQVLTALAEGRSGREIADELFLSQETVKTHVGNVIRKLGVQSRAEAVAQAFRLGLIHADPEAPARYRVKVQGQYPKYGRIPLCTDLAEVSSAVLRYLYNRVGFSLWMVTQAESDDWIILHALDRFYGMKAGSVYRWSDSFCSRMVSGEGPRLAPASDEVEAYRTAPIGKQLSIGAYVGVPIEREDGSLFGTLCAIDPSPQPEASPEELETVELVARLLGRVL